MRKFWAEKKVGGDPFTTETSHGMILQVGSLIQGNLMKVSRSTWKDLGEEAVHQKLNRTLPADP